MRSQSSGSTLPSGNSAVIWIDAPAGTHSEQHWTMMAFVPAIIAAGRYADEAWARAKRLPVLGAVGVAVSGLLFVLGALVVAQDHMEVELDLRTEASWTSSILQGGDAELSVPAFSLRCRVADLYERTPLQPRARG